jgi:NADPH:quinone reductase-like Zn-dependent oxidoreductase
MVSAVAPPNARLATEHGVRADYFIVDVNSAQLATIADMLDKKQIAAPVGAVLTLAEARAAHEMMAGERPRPRGKIVPPLRPTRRGPSARRAVSRAPQAS